MRTICLTLALALAALLALPDATRAQTPQPPMTGAQFDAYTLGKTLTYLLDGVPYGAEQYSPGRRVIWAFSEDECKKGSWSEPEPALICFTYDDSPENPQCWRFYRTPNGLRAEFDGDTEGVDLYEAQQTSDPLFCPGPKVGA